MTAISYYPKIILKRITEKVIRCIDNILPQWLSLIVGKVKKSSFLKSFYFLENKLIYNCHKKYDEKLKNLKKKSKIKVVFFVIQSSIWKYEELYNLMEVDEKFDPIIIACSSVIYGNEEMEIIYNNFNKKKYNVVKAYNAGNDKWLDIKAEIQPDVVFFTLPYEYTKEDYFITNFLDCLTCYVPYSFTITNLLPTAYDLLFHNLLWKAFYETSIHYEIAKKCARNKASNVVITGYPGTDVFLNKNYKPKNVWKIKEKKILKIIWAPHHTIDNSKSQINFSNFLKYYQTMIDLAIKHYDKIQIAFKPHPLLKQKLYKDKNWGIERTNQYYEKWRDLPNGQLEESEYIDLFMTSDALIHDSGSFMIEYIFLHKPVLFTIKDAKIRERLNLFGNLVLDQLYKAHNEDDIFSFIENVVISGNDMKYDNREKFLNKYLIPSKTGNASVNIINEIKEAIN